MRAELSKIHATSVNNEREFSVASRIETVQRMRLGEEKLDKIIFINNNIK